MRIPDRKRDSHVVACGAQAERLAMFDGALIERSDHTTIDTVAADRLCGKNHRPILSIRRRCSIVRKVMGA